MRVIGSYVARNAVAFVALFFAMSGTAFAVGSAMWTGDNIVDGTLTGADVADGTVTGADVQAGSITASDLAGSVTGDLDVARHIVAAPAPYELDPTTGRPAEGTSTVFLASLPGGGSLRAYCVGINPDGSGGAQILFYEVSNPSSEGLIINRQYVPAGEMHYATGAFSDRFLVYPESASDYEVFDYEGYTTPDNQSCIFDLLGKKGTFS